jgi:hypothetical protein
MKKVGIIVLVIGLIITLFTGFSYVTKKKVVDIGKLEITADKKHNVAWSPLVGIAIMVIGAGMIFYGVKKP